MHGALALLGKKFAFVDIPQHTYPDYSIMNFPVPVFLEVKNLSGKYYLNPSLVKREILARFLPVRGSYIKLLVVSRLKASERSRALLRKAGVHIIEIGFQIRDNESVRRAARIVCDRLKRLLSHLLGVFTWSKLRRMESCEEGCGSNKLQERDRRVTTDQGVPLQACSPSRDFTSRSLPRKGSSQDVWHAERLQSSSQQLWREMGKSKATVIKIVPSTNFRASCRRSKEAPRWAGYAIRASSVGQVQPFARAC